MHSWRWGIVLAAAIILISLTVGIWRSPHHPTVDSSVSVRKSPVDHARRSARDEEFVGSAVCAECHAKIVIAYQGHPMGISTSAAMAASPIEDYQQKTSFDSGRGLQFRVERTADTISHHEVCLSGDDVVYDRKVDVQWAIGSGKRGRSYVFERAGMLLMSPISWYSQRGIWDLSPGYTEETSNRFSRRVTDGCAACHIGRANPQANAPDRFEQPVALEAAIGCERCHGPAGPHVRKHRSTAPNDGPDPIVNPGKLPVVERESVCNQCHLQGYRRILRARCTPFDFHPGQRLDDVWTVFVGPAQVNEREQSTAAVSQVEQMRSSRCYLGSSGQLGCISCHDPHSVVDEKSRASAYEHRCQSCHETHGCGLSAEERSNSPTGSSCIDCHMPRLTASDIPHTSQTDHRILRDPKSTASRPDKPEEFTLSIFDEETTRVPEGDRLRAKVLLRLAEAQRARDTESARQIQQQLLQILDAFSDDPEVLAGMATVSMILNEPQSAEKYWLKVLAARPNDEKTIEQLALFHLWKKNSAQARLYLEKALALNPENVEIMGRYARFLADAGDWPASLEVAEKGLRIDPTFHPLRSWLANAYRQRGDATNAEKHLRLLNLAKAVNTRTRQP